MMAGVPPFWESRGTRGQTVFPHPPLCKQGGRKWVSTYARVREDLWALTGELTGPGAAGGTAGTAGAQSP